MKTEFAAIFTRIDRYCLDPVEVESARRTIESFSAVDVVSHRRTGSWTLGFWDRFAGQVEQSGVAFMSFDMFQRSLFDN